jgi:hypothetical protein
MNSDLSFQYTSLASLTLICLVIVAGKCVNTKCPIAEIANTILIKIIKITKKSTVDSNFIIIYLQINKLILKNNKYIIMNFTPLDQAYQVHHGNPSMYTTNKIQTVNPKCIFCGNTNTFPLMEKQDGGIFRQCDSKLCRKQFTSSTISQANSWKPQQPMQQQPMQQQPMQQQPMQQQQQQNPYLPTEPNFISRFNINPNPNQKI